MDGMIYGQLDSLLDGMKQQQSLLQEQNNLLRQQNALLEQQNLLANQRNDLLRLLIHVSSTAVDAVAPPGFMQSIDNMLDQYSDLMKIRAARSKCK